MRKTQMIALAAMSAITVGLSGCSGNTQTGTSTQASTVTETTGAVQETVSDETSENDVNGTEQENTADVNNDIYDGLTEDEIAQIEASMKEILEKNQFGLVYNGAITENVEGQVNIQSVSYENQRGISLAANLYLPADYDENSSYPAIVVAHPNGGVKEQVSGLFAQRLAENGYITIAFDAAYQGASGGTPRNTDLPSNRVEDIRAAIDYLTSVAGVDENRIGALGICGGGGYTIEASKTDKRISAVATVSMFNSGRVRRNGMSDSDIEGIPARQEQAAEAREKYVSTGEIDYIGSLGTQRQDYTAEQLEQIPAGLYRDGVEYYGSTHFHPYSQSRYTAMSLMDLMAFDAEDQAELIDQPLLMIAGDISDTRYMTEGVFEKVTGTDDKELVLIEGAQHIETYWKEEFVQQEMDALTEFFGAKLAEESVS
ncbi:MAG: alpha/beta hydrolase [Lachnoclostridium edouardi]|uniref:alpha/beta hydrolase n=1 Tax=Lachnoclostridium edouardi TaxID=1926283 RepID=UPI0026DDC4C6|nr:alpha/beta hydrolase [Lachnoclostridium edouardi]MDO4278640.1 alpha/beta hydrolase [Lachnoclostridium edouardi]